MAVDIVQHINDNSGWSAEEKTAFLDDYVAAKGYTDANQGTKKAFANAQINRSIKHWRERAYLS